MKKLVIFDLDKTVIDSNHRYATLPNSQDIDLAHWRENCTPDKIRKDKLLPMIRVMRAAFACKGIMVAICTARVMSPFDWKFLRDNNVPFHYAMHRPEGCNTADAILKKQQILKLSAELSLSLRQFSKIEIYDDNQTVLTMASEIGIKPFCSVKINAQLGSLG